MIMAVCKLKKPRLSSSRLIVVGRSRERQAFEGFLNLVAHSADRAAPSKLRSVTQNTGTTTDLLYRRARLMQKG